MQYFPPRSRSLFCASNAAFSWQSWVVAESNVTVPSNEGSPAVGLEKTTLYICAASGKNASSQPFCRFPNDQFCVTKKGREVQAQGSHAFLIQRKKNEVFGTTGQLENRNINSHLVSDWFIFDVLQDGSKMFYIIYNYV